MERNALSSPGKPQATCRLRLTKTGPARFMSHLDFIRAVERAVRRADLPVALTEGFHPHPRMSFSPALPVGVESECELVDVDLRERPGADEVARRLGRALPPGLRLVSCVVLPRGGPSLSSMIRAASYQVDFARDNVAGRPDVIEAAIEGLLRADAIPISRTTPKGTREFNLRPLIYDLRLLREEGAASVRMLVAAGPRGHVRPDDVAREIARRAGLGPGARPARIVRKEFYVERDGRFLPLL
ncbi:MAG: hypothetical protein PWR07_41 [Bacillota bacterium]|nr:TIGR03936 family radical SAM-associated protein [Bacillota bacterium]MDK2929910.1 hypothetical protein [Bacillota bacterium]